MLAKVISCALYGIEGYMIDVEVDIGSGLPGFDLVGLPDSSIKESKERVRTAIKNAGFSFPAKKITINLAPADIRKEGSSFDLPIALGILACTNVFPKKMLENTFFAGELSLDGSIRRINGVLPMVYAAFENGIQRCVIPYENRDEAVLIKEMEVFAPRTLKELADFLLSKVGLKPYEAKKDNLAHLQTTDILDFSDVKGQENVKRAMEIAAAGYHNLLMTGPPGSGKTMLAKRLPSILPDLTFEESIQITKIYSVAGLLKNKSSLITTRPFRSPHHTVSAVALTGGGRIPRPGEISLATGGMLFLDELPEFQRGALEVLRQPLEDGVVTIARVNGTITYPASFMLIAAMNPCPCGYRGSNRCRCTDNEIARYAGKISGPLLDRIDIQVETPSIRYHDLDSQKKAQTTAEIKQRVLAAHRIQVERYQKESIVFNSQLTAPLIEKYCKLGKPERLFLKSAFDRLGLSARGYHKILKVARTVADLNAEKDITVLHIAEVIQYRNLDRASR